MGHSTQQSTTYEGASEQQEHSYYEDVPTEQTQLQAQQVQPVQPIKQKNLWLSVLWTIVQMVVVGVVTYVLVNFIFSMSIWNSLQKDTMVPGPDSAVGSVEVPNQTVPDSMVHGQNSAETVPVLDLPEQVIAGQRFEYTFARSAYGAEGVSAVYIDFGDGTRMEYVSGNAPESGQHAYADTGRYTATLTIVDAQGVEHTDTCTVLVSDSDQDDAQGPEIVSV